MKAFGTHIPFWFITLRDYLQLKIVNKNNTINRYKKLGTIIKGYDD